MPDSSVAEIYSTPEINIPPTFPFILKQYAKAAIRTQPYDLLRWSAAYFRALAKGEEPPIKDRLEYPPPDTPSGLSPGFLKVLIKQIGKGGIITINQLLERWNGICLAQEPLQEMLAVGQFGDTFDWLHFVAVAAGFLSHNLTQTMVLLCNLLTDEPDGGSAMIPLQTFTKLYTFLASLDCGGPNDHEEEIENRHEYMITEGQRDKLSLFSADLACLKRESVESCPTDPSIFEVDWESHSAHQIYVEKRSPFPSPPSSCACTPPLDMENASTTTLTPESQHCPLQDQECAEVTPGPGATIETFYDAKIKGSPHSSQDFVSEGKRKEESEQLLEPSNTVSNKEKRSITLIHQNTLEEPAVLSSLSVQSTGLSRSVSGRGDVEEKVLKPLFQELSVKTVKDSIRETISKRHVPGIGATVDAVQMQAVLDYLEGVGLKQDGMVKPSNIRHFLCPPLEKVPASQKTRV